LPYIRPGYTVVLAFTILMYIVLTMSWALFSGPTGYLSLATAAFFGIGIYTSAVLGMKLPLPVVVVAGGVASACLAFLVGALTLRLKGIYFAIFTFGLVELMKYFVLWYELKYTGTRGRFLLPVDNNVIYYVMLVILVALLLTTYFIRRSKYGFALQSIGEDEEAAAHTGINEGYHLCHQRGFRWSRRRNLGHTIDIYRPIHCLQLSQFFHAGVNGHLWGHGTDLWSRPWCRRLFLRERSPDHQVSLPLHAPHRHHTAAGHLVPAQWACRTDSKMAETWVGEATCHYLKGKG
jgi:hypothetical protein